MSKKYISDGGNIGFNHKKFKELIDEMAKTNGCSNSWVYKEICKSLKMDIGSCWNKVYKWYIGKNAPVDTQIVQDLANFFGIDIEELYERKNTMINEEINTKHKLNDIQKKEIFRLKDCILDYLFKNYSSVLFEDYYSHPYYRQGDVSIIDVAIRFLNYGDEIKANKYYSDEELKTIDKEFKEETKYLENKQKVARPDTHLLDEYRMFCEYKDIYKLFQQIERSMCILPKEIIDRFIKLINFIPTSEEYFSELSFYNNDLDLESYDNRKIYESFDDVIDVENYKNSDEYKKLSSKEQFRKEAIVESVYNKSYYIHKCLNDIIKTYCFD